MHTIANLTAQDARILAELASREYSDKAFRVCRAMQECDYVDAAIMLEHVRRLSLVAYKPTPSHLTRHAAEKRNAAVLTSAEG